MNLLPIRSRVPSASLSGTARSRSGLARRHVLRGFAVAGFTALLAACSTAPSKPIFPEITFADEPKLTFAASAVQTVQEYQPSAQPPHIELTVPQSPVLVAQRWARDRVAVDNTQPYSVVVTIKKASVTEEDLRKTPGLKGSFTKDQVARFTTDVAMNVELRDTRGFRVATATASATRSNTLGEDATLNDRDRLLYDLVSATMKDVDRELENNIRQYMPLYVH
jgi:hypothetical protein